MGLELPTVLKYYDAGCCLDVTTNSSGIIQTITGKYATKSLAGAIFGDGRNFCKNIPKGKGDI
jgi:hypothetical protein